MCLHMYTHRHEVDKFIDTVIERKKDRDLQKLTEIERPTGGTRKNKFFSLRFYCMYIYTLINIMADVGPFYN